jgi:putative molybdopterin biosynthesis protein
MAHNVALSTEEVAKILHVSKSTVYELIRQGELGSYKIGRKVRFTQEDVDTYVARSRHEQSTAPVTRVTVQSSLLYGESNTSREFILSGQDVIIDILSHYLRDYGVCALRAYIGSFEGLLSLYQDKVHVCMTHLWDGDNDDYNTAYARRLMPGTSAVIINMTYRTQGFYVQKGNPKNIRSWEDLLNPDVVMINRRKGSATRVLLDEHLRKMDVSGKSVRGYNVELNSHLTLAAAVARGEADVGLGTERIARHNENLSFVPLQRERCDIVVKKEAYNTTEVATMLRILRSGDFLKEISSLSGNDYRDMGTIMAEV